MKHSELIKKSISFAGLFLTLTLADRASAFTYSDTDLMLVFRKDNFNDVEFNLGTVSNYLGKANGTAIPVSNWDLSVVKANFNNSLAGVKFCLVSATGNTDPLRRAWVTDANATGNPADISGSKMSTLHSKIEFVGLQAQSFTATNASETYIVASGDLSSYTYIASEGGHLDATTIGGAAPFPVDSANPATNRFVELKVSNATPKPAATIVGTFSLTAAGVLTFTAGPPVPQPTITHVSRSGGTTSVSFTTVAGMNYRLRHTAAVGATKVPAWTASATTIAGDGSIKTLTDDSADTQQFYAVEAFQ